MNIVVVVKRETNLLQVVLALCAARGFACLLHNLGPLIDRIEELDAESSSPATWNHPASAAWCERRATTAIALPCYGPTS